MWPAAGLRSLTILFDKLKERFTRYRPRDEKENLDFSGPSDPRELKEEQVRKSRRYHAYFDGYVERKVWNIKKQKEVIDRVYVENYYYRDLTKRQRALNIALYYALCIGGLMLFVWGSQQRIDAQVKYIYLPGAAVLVAEVALLWALANYSAAPAKLTIWEYRAGSRRLIQVSFVAACCIAAQAVVLLVYVLVVREGGSPCTRVCCILGNLFSAGATFGIYLLEKRATYIQIENENGYLKDRDDVHLIKR